MSVLSPEAEARICRGASWLGVASVELGVSMDIIAQRSGIHPMRLAVIGLQQDGPDEDEFEAIAKALGVTTEEIDGWQD